MSKTISVGTAAQLRIAGIPEESHTVEALRSLIPPFEGIHEMEDPEALAEIVIYLGRHQIVPVKENSWKSLPWGAHACLFYKTTAELEQAIRNYFREGLITNEKCIWIVPKPFGFEKGQTLIQKLMAETGSKPECFEVIRHQDWYETPSGRFRSHSEIIMGWLSKIEDAIRNGFHGARVSGDAHCHPDDLKSFFDYEQTVNESVGTLKIKALCAYCIPNFTAFQIRHILDTHQSVFGDLALSAQ